MEYYQQSKAELIAHLDTSLEGLEESQVLVHRKQYGENALNEGRKENILSIFLGQYKDALVIILIISAIISGILDDIQSAVIIFVVITMNAILGTVQHCKAQQSLEGLKAMSVPSAKVRRQGVIQVIPSREVVVGDILILDAGDFVCSDGRILENASLKCAESALTGESEPVEKADCTLQDEVALGDRKNMVYSGSFVTYGRGEVLVTATGMDTEIGKIAALLNATEEKKTPLQVSLDNFGKKLSIGILIVSALVFTLSVVRGNDLVDAFIFAVALAVAAIPEALSSIVTIVLAMGTQKLAKENAIVRKLQAVEGLGSVSIICSDKTGTLTQNKMTIRKLYVDGRISDLSIPPSENEKALVLAGTLCSDANIIEGKEIGDPTETAIIALAQKWGMHTERVREALTRLGEIPFDSDRKLMSTVHNLDGKLTMLTKGAVDVLLPRIEKIQTERGIRNFTKEDALALQDSNLTLSNEGLRVLAMCQKSINRTDVSLSDEEGYTLMGLFAMQDPPREESAKAVEKCKLAGIRPIMITGDHLITASAIARQIGILDDCHIAVEGAELDTLTDEELRDFVDRVSVYARVSPEHKIRIVHAWQARGNIVSMTGDGVNDAPALKQADVGVAMGITGSEVAKDSASFVLTDDNFATIVKAIENGRNLYDNIKRAILFLLSGNFAAILAVLYCSLLNLPVPFKAVHLLFINLLTDSLPAIALGMEPHSSEVMKQSPRPKNESILNKPILQQIGLGGVVIAFLVIVAFLIGLQTSEELASTMAFSVLCLARLFHSYNCKSSHSIVFTKRMWNNKAIQGALLIGFVLLNLVLWIPGLHGLFSVADLDVAHILMIYGLGFAVIPLMQIVLYVRTRICHRND